MSNPQIFSNITTKEIEARAGEQLEEPAVIERKIGLPPGYLAQRRNSQRGPRYHLIAGRVVLYKESDVRAWLARATAEGR